MNPRTLHGNGIVGVPFHVPARAHASLGKQGMRAGNVFFRLLRINFIVHLVVLERYGEKADTVDAAGRGACGGKEVADVEPESVTQIDDYESHKCGEECA